MKRPRGRFVRNVYRVGLARAARGDETCAFDPGAWRRDPLKAMPPEIDAYALRSLRREREETRDAGASRVSSQDEGAARRRR